MSDKKMILNLSNETFKVLEELRKAYGDENFGNVITRALGTQKMMAQTRTKGGSVFIKESNTDSLKKVDLE